MIETINSPYIHAATANNFELLALNNSKGGPVLANYWSRKAGPCLRQYPILDKLVHHYAGRLLLVNIDTDMEISVPKDYGVTCVPTLKLFRDGQVLETLHGYQSEQDLVKVLDLYVVRDSDLVLAKALQHYSAGKTAAAFEMIADATVADPVNPRLPLAMCKFLKHEQRYEEALTLIHTSPDHIRGNPEVVQLQALLHFCLKAVANSEVETLLAHSESNPNDLAAKQQVTAHYVIQRKYEQALEELVKIMDIGPIYNDNYAQHAMLRIFKILGAGDERVAKYRPYLRRYTH